MQINWAAPPSQPWSLVVSASGVQQPRRGVTLILSRAVEGGWEKLVADADGPVRQAVFETDACTLQASGFQGDFYAFGVRMGSGGGAFAGTLTDWPERVAITSFTPMALVVGKPGALDLKTMLLHDWNGAAPIAVHAPKDAGFLEDSAVFSGDSLFWNASSGCVSKIKAWTRDGGTADFIAHGDSNGSEGAGDLGTDGQDLVWMHGSGGCDARSLLYERASVMTAPFTSAPAQLRPRRLRSEVPNGLGVAPFIVNCGYAARQTYRGIRLLRLADGVSWLLSTASEGRWRWEIPLAVTCGELFAQVLVRLRGGPAEVRYVRATIASLGPGAPPDGPEEPGRSSRLP
jgi:hypothetical protein